MNKSSTLVLNKYLQKTLGNARGQIALFITLVFPLIFVFFAMVINVGLVVHHKINLQNSVDLAAYYGAMKQAESLNMIAHMNYQLRQNWKLLSVRYRSFGSAGLDASPISSKEEKGNPYNPITGAFNQESGGNANREFPVAIDPSIPRTGPSFCIQYEPFFLLQPGENYCRALQLSPLRLPEIPRLTGILAGLGAALNTRMSTAYRNIENKCKQLGVVNWIALARFYVAFKMEQANRRTWINLIANGLSGKEAPGGAEKDFWDIEGLSVKSGAQVTFEKNLTDANKTSIRDFELFNSLGKSPCGPGETWDASPKWLKEIRVNPRLAYLDSKNTSACSLPDGGTLEYAVREISPDVSAAGGNKPVFEFEAAGFTSIMNELAGYFGINSTAPLTNPVVGVEKNPWCVAYVGIKATTQPKIPFSPFGSVTMKAKAYAKPFGGRIGPWYKSEWAQASEFSNNGATIDSNLPERAEAAGSDNCNSLGGGSTATTPPNCFPNYSRSPSISIGTRLPIAHLNKAIRNVTFMSPGLGMEVWANIYKDFTTGPEADILAWDPAAKGSTQVRQVEIAAVSPDVFDIYYYSIEPEFYKNYAVRVGSFYKNKTVNPAHNHTPSGPRGDLGQRSDDATLSAFSIKNQIEVAKNPGILDTSVSGLWYMVIDWKHLLTGWISNVKDVSEGYRLDESRFGRCEVEVGASSPSIPGGCISKGGRTGYSVKMVAEDWLLNGSLSLGGENSAGSIKNQPPENFKKY